MGLHMSDLGEIQETAPNRTWLDAPDHAPNCVLRTWRNGRAATVDSFCRAGSGIRRRTLFEGSAAFVLPSPSKAFVAVVDATSAHVASVGGDHLVSGAAYVDSSRAVWIGDDVLLLYGRESARLLDARARTYGEPLICNGRPLVIAAVLVNSGAPVQILDRNGASISWRADARRLDCPD